MHVGVNIIIIAIFFLTPGIEEGRNCSISEDFIDDVIERSRELLSNVDDREIVSRLSNFIIPCRRGLVCRAETLTRRVCRPENDRG